MSEFPRAPGTPEPDAAAIIEQIRAYARREPAEDPDDNALRLIGLHHILDAARDHLAIGMAIVNTKGPGKLAIRTQAEILGLGVHLTADKHIKRGRQQLEQEAGPPAADGNP